MEEELNGFKRAYLAVKIDRMSGEVVDAGFKSHVADTMYRTLDTATCRLGRPHRAPARGCTCGFYALKDAEKVRNLAFAGARISDPQATSAVLSVRLFGAEVLEGERGFRSSNQLVTGVEVDPRCFTCQKPAISLVPSTLVSSQLDGDVWMLTAVCEQHAAVALDIHLPFSLADLSGAYGTDISFAESPASIAPQSERSARSVASASRAAGLASVISLALVFLLSSVNGGLDSANRERLLVAMTMAVVWNLLLFSLSLMLRQVDVWATWRGVIVMGLFSGLIAGMAYNVTMLPSSTPAFASALRTELSDDLYAPSTALRNLVALGFVAADDGSWTPGDMTDPRRWDELLALNDVNARVMSGPTSTKDHVSMSSQMGAAGSLTFALPIFDSDTSTVITRCAVYNVTISSEVSSFDGAAPSTTTTPSTAAGPSGPTSLTAPNLDGAVAPKKPYLVAAAQFTIPANNGACDAASVFGS